ncbi:hypothetical protein FNV43_RR26077 [Rhamnella rubrinervis]|uniref:Cytochrome P450 CYP749A22-like n=1 Tax=Rhamnella rubrinervis TaxID=2594499 RepID=A0A8K0DJ09_9ROSA|nr:hypothetical protein FNV43_RR26077 [Rhamnella rubrinervis]
MSWPVDVVMILSSFLGLFSLFTLFKLFHKLWWSPTRMHRLMSSQGIKGPPYRLIHGNTKEIMTMKKQAMETPILGLSHDIFPRVQPHIESWVNKYGKNYLQWYGAEAQLVVTEPELIKEILNNRDKAFPKFEKNAFAVKLFGDGILNVEGEKWAKLRKLANHAFHGERLNAMVPEMISGVEIMLERWKQHHQGKEIDVFEEFRLLTSDVISKTAFGSSYHKGKDIFEMMARLALLTSKNSFKLSIPILSKFFRTSDEIESDKLEKETRSSIIELIKEREEKVISSGEENSFGNDYLGSLIKAHHDPDKKQRISVDNMIDECKTFYFAGQETTKTLLAWTVLLLAIHTDWQEQVREEVLTLFGQQNPNPDSIAKLKKMGMVFNESLRLYPPAITFKRKVERETRVGKLILPANLNVHMSTLALHHDPELWGEDVHEFKPERFSQGVAHATNNNPAAFFPFGMGPRNCVGSSFALIEAKIALSMILQRHAFTLSPAYVHTPHQLLTLHPQHGIQVRLH